MKSPQIHVKNYYNHVKSHHICDQSFDQGLPRFLHIQIPHILASFELSYVSPDSLKIRETCEKNEEWKVEVGGEKRASRFFR